MSNFFHISLILCCLVLAAAGKPSVTTKRNRDGSLLVLQQNESHRHGVRQIAVAFKLNRQSRAKPLLKLTQSLEEAPTGGADLMDIDRDGFYELEVTGMCGAGPNCEKNLYKLDRAATRMYHFFSGGASEISWFDGYLVELGRASCCSWKYHLYKITGRRRLTTYDDMSFMIDVSATGDDRGNVTQTQCTFKRRVKQNFVVVNPPTAKWLKLCEVYDAEYKVTPPIGMPD